MTKATLTKFPGVHRRKDSGIYQFGLRAPVDLLTHFPSGWAVRVSLGTPDLRTANEKAKMLQAEWSGKFDALRSGKPPPVDLVSVRAKLLTSLERLATVVDQQCSRLSLPDRKEHVRMLDWQLDYARDAIRGRYVPDWAEETLNKLGKLGIARGTLADDEAMSYLVASLEIRHEALVDETRTFPIRVGILAARRELIESMVSVAATHGTKNLGKQASVGLGPKIADALQVWSETKRPEKTVGAFTRHAKQFSDLMGNPSLKDVDKLMALEFRDKLQQWAVEKGKTANTADNVLVSIRALVNVARDKGWIPGNPFERLTVKVGGKESEGREPWTHPELKILFDDPIWTEGKLPSDRKAGGVAAYWIPLIACYTGARVTEIAQLWTDDLDIAPGQEVIEFCSNAERGQKLKNKGS